MDVQRILKNSAEDWDGGYAMAGLIGHGDAFVLRDPCGIRPAFWYEDDEITVVASERPVIQTAFKLKWEDVNEFHIRETEAFMYANFITYDKLVFKRFEINENATLTLARESVFSCLQASGPPDASLCNS